MTLWREWAPRVMAMLVLGTLKYLESNLISATLASPSCAPACKYTVSSPVAVSTIFSCELPGLTNTEYVAIYILYTRRAIMVTYAKV